MKLEYDLSIKQEQKLVMTPELLQAIQILQYNSYELESFVNEQLVSNPVLEQLLESKPKEKITREDAIGQFIGQYGGQPKEGSSYNEDEGNNYENYGTTETTLIEHLLFQLQFVCQGKEESNIGKYIIENIDENGYLTMDVDVIAENLNKSVDAVKEVLDKIKCFDPMGVGARNLKESLKIQLDLTGRLDNQVEKIIDDHLEEIALNKISEISKAMSMSKKEVQQITDLIKSLEPKPGSYFSSNQKTTYVVPDVFVNKNQDGDYEVEISESSTPQLMVSSYYEKLLRESKSDEIVKTYLSEKIESAIWLIKNIEQRKNTILNVSKSIVKHQREFFDGGEKYLKTLTLKEIADELDIHESTVSRTINGKYLQCSRGVYELKFFFSAGVSSTRGEGISSNSIKTYLKEIIEEEDPKSPYSDRKLAQMLKAKGFDISRRTVAKYRDELGILSSSGRKRY